MHSQNADSTAPFNWFFPFAMALSAALLSITLTISNGFLEDKPRDWATILLLSLALLSCLAGIVFHDAKLPAPIQVPLARLLGHAPEIPVLAVTCAVQVMALIGRYYRVRVFSLPLTAFFLLGALLAFFWFRYSPIVNRRWTMGQLVFGCATLACFTFCAVQVIHATAIDFVDVIVFQRESSRALVSGINPYAITFPDIYGAGSDFYGPGISVNGRLQFGFPYLPLSLLWVMPAQLLLGDFRFGHLLAVALAAIFVATLRPSRTAAAAAMLLAFSAPAFYVLQIGWTEPVVAMLFCFNIWLLSRRAPAASAENAASAVALGLFLATKQYLIFAIPLLFLLPLQSACTRMGARWKTLLVALSVAALTALPFALWNVRAFWWSVFALQFRQPFRDNSLSYLSAFKELSGVQLSSAICFVLAAGAVWLCWKRAPRSVAGFSASVALVYFVFFAFNKQAFANYYFFVFVALCCATAAAQRESDAA